MIKEILEDALPIIIKNAPSIAEAIESPFNGVAQIAISLLSDAFNTPSKDPKELAKQILSNVTSPEKLKALDEEHGNALKSLNIKMPCSVEINIKLNWNK